MNTTKVDYTNPISLEIEGTLTVEVKHVSSIKATVLKAEDFIKGKGLHTFLKLEQGAVLFDEKELTGFVDYELKGVM